MRNFILALGGLAVVILGIFIFTSNFSGKNDDIIIPTPQPVNSPSPSFMITNQKQNPFPILGEGEISKTKVTLSIEKGDIIFELFDDAPIAVSNFVYLVNKKFYDGLTFHRVEKDFVVQGGDPNGDGTGGPGYSFVDEEVKREYLRGVVAMANAGPNTNGSQFFIVLKDTPELPKNYTIFGKVIEGIEIVDQIEVGDKIIKTLISSF